MPSGRSTNWREDRSDGAASIASCAICAAAGRDRSESRKRESGMFCTNQLQVRYLDLVTATDRSLLTLLIAGLGLTRRVDEVPLSPNIRAAIVWFPAVPARSLRIREISNRLTSA